VRYLCKRQSATLIFSCSVYSLDTVCFLCDMYYIDESEHVHHPGLHSACHLEVNSPCVYVIGSLCQSVMIFRTISTELLTFPVVALKICGRADGYINTLNGNHYHDLVTCTQHRNCLSVYTVSRISLSLRH
jgi:hypothetical protein